MHCVAGGAVDLGMTLRSPQCVGVDGNAVIVREGNAVSRSLGKGSDSVALLANFFFDSNLLKIGNRLYVANVFVCDRQLLLNVVARQAA